MADSTFELELTAMAHGGAAFGRHEGRAIFVPYALPGEKVLARVTQDKDRFACAEVVKIIKPSPARAESPCPHFGPGHCGGCHWQRIDYAAQIEFKRQVTLDQLRRIGKLPDTEVLPTIPSAQPYGYRAHMTFAVAEDGSLGLWSDDNESIIPIEECHIAHPALMELASALDLGSPEILRVRLQVGSDPADRSIALETDRDDAPEIEVDLPVSVNLIARDNEPVNLIGSPHVTYNVLGRKFRATAGGFFQANAAMAGTLAQEVLARLSLEGAETTLDLFSGVGLFTAFMAERCALVTSVESYPPAVSDAEHNLADLPNAEIIEGSVEAFLGAATGGYDAVTVDPPRTGLSAEATRGLIRLAAPRIVYVSCDPATFARDARRLVDGGYRLEAVQPIDMFPQTFHIETVAAFSRAD